MIRLPLALHDCQPFPLPLILAAVTPWNPGISTASLLRVQPVSVSPELPGAALELPDPVPPSLAPWVPPSRWETSIHPARPQHLCSTLLSCRHRMGGCKTNPLEKPEQLCVGLGSPEHNMHQLLPPEQLLLSGRKRLLPAPALKLPGRSFALGRRHSNSSKGQNHAADSACVCFWPLGACSYPASSGYQEGEPSILLQKKRKEIKIMEKLLL